MGQCGKFWFHESSYPIQRFRRKRSKDILEGFFHEEWQVVFFVPKTSSPLEARVLEFMCIDGDYHKFKMSPPYEDNNLKYYMIPNELMVKNNRHEEIATMIQDQWEKT
jgi:hypothetical protein